MNPHAERLQGKTALVTAAGQGIGRAVAIAFASCGASVIGADINEHTLAEINTIDNLTAHKLDVTNPEDVAAAIRSFGKIDILFNGAGYVHQGSILDCNQQDWDFSINLNVTSMYRVCRAALPAMVENGGGSIINMSSVASSLKGVPNRCVYSVTKAAVIGLTKSIAADFITQGIRCNAICPGTIDSPSLHDRLRALGDYEQAMKTFVARQPMGRIGKPEEVAALATWLASDESAFTSGHVHYVDGGWAA